MISFSYVADVESIDFGLQHYRSVGRYGNLRLVSIPGFTIQMLKEKGSIMTFHYGLNTEKKTPTGIL